jgi:hypothetical protein
MEERKKEKELWSNWRLSNGRRTDLKCRSC